MARVRLPHLALTLAASIWLAILCLAPVDWPLLARLWFLPLIGTAGAIIANTSGTGGGVVFVPVFSIFREWGVLDLSPIEVTAASFLIQCFGMTMGAARWTDRLIHQPAGPDAPVRLGDYARICAVVLLISLPVMLATQRLAAFDAQSVLLGFKGFSILFGSVLLIATWTVNRDLPERRQLAPVDLAVVALLAVPGGFVTAFFSVGVGELVALYLFTRHYPVLLSTGAACVISAVSVLAGAIWHVDAGTIPWEVVLLAGPGAMVGGFLARPIALWLGALRLKTLDGLWIVGSSLYLVALNWR
ncbi:MAG: sulfite exporter TauE/SafE family protein [Sphingopyxis sp.]|uniref:sulfite exporter TauE/SafE family protein n=1 Tax=Sphingopyxis sp. TaxID=1908224 RepID=UPI002ABA2DB8|nr:sulfite exporter TauE/SafE family protein [Sphingopyxis sp.]MDZ3830191.1 sulfite exporter TauE/SafE family protein [Sphingopyxis sp.]